MKTLGITHSVCNTCRRLVPAKLTADGDGVYAEKFCPEHGLTRALIRRNVDDYVRTLRYVKPAWIPETHGGDATAACPTGCGFCTRHEQHLCMPLVEITTRCNLACPICLVDAGQLWDIGRAEFGRLLDGLMKAERQIDILNLSGGEPLLHPDLLDLIDDALARPEIVRVSISTNGLELLRRPDLLDRMQQRNVVVSLQFDGFKPQADEVLRGRPLLDEKRRILDMLQERHATTSLTMTVAGGLNDDQFPAVLKYYFSQPHIVSLMLQPLTFTGRARQLSGRFARLTIPDVIELLDAAGVPPVRAADFVPLPCSHPLCFTLAFYLMLDDGGIASLNGLIEAEKWLDTLANRTVFGLDAEEQDRMKEIVYDLWSGPVGLAPDSQSVMRTLRRALDEMTAGRFDPRRAFAITERRVKSIFIHAFQDAETFDLARVRRCCNAYPQPDGTLRPACVRNVVW